MAPAFIVRATWLWVGLGVFGLAYMVFCPYQFHKTYADFCAGLFVGFAIVACFVRAPRTVS